MAAVARPRSRQLSAADGTPLHVTDYLLPAAACHGSIVIMHGLGDHSGRYFRLSQFLNDCGLSVRCYDHRGHGRSGGKRGDVIYGDPMLQDAEIVIDDFAAGFDRAPFLLGHSMGGLFAARFALERRSRLRGLVLSSPALAVNLSGFEQRLMALMQVLAPSLGLPNGLPLTYLSRDPAVVAAYKADPLVHGRISTRLVRSMLDSVDYCHAQAPTLALPTLMLVAGDDRLVDAAGSRRFHAATPEGMARLHVYDGFYHEVFNEPDAARPLADLKDWLCRFS